MSVWLKGYSKEKNTMACFRLKINGRHKKTTLKMAATGSYKIFLDAKLIGCGPRRALMGESVVNEYDITQYIYNKNSYLTVEIIYSGTDSFYIVDEQPFFYCEINGDGELIANEKDFESYINLSKIQKVGRYSYQRGFLENYRFDNNPYLNYLGETFGWQKCETEVVKSNVLVYVDLPYPTFEKMPFQEIEQGGVIDREDKTPVPCGKSSAFNALTVAFPDSELESDVVAELSKYVLDVTAKSTNRFYTFELEKSKTGFFEFVAEVDNDCEIYCVFDEICNYEKILHHSVPKDVAKKVFDDLYVNGTLPVHFSRMSTINIIKFKLKKGKYDLSCFEPYTMKYLRIIAVGANVQLSNVNFTLYENSDFYREYSGIDEKEKKVYDAALSTLAQNAVDILTDCPSRERGGWLCDSYFSSRVEYFLTGKNRIEKNFLNCFLKMDWRKDLPIGMFPMVYPSNQYIGKFIPNWAMFLLLEIEEYSIRNNDRKFVDDFEERAYLLYEYFKKFENEYGLLEDLESWVFVEWSKSNEYTYGVNFPTNMLYCEFLMCLSRLYSDKELKEKAQKLNKTINDLSFNGTFYEDNAVRENGKLILKGNITETCQYYAFYFNIATEKTRKRLYDILFTEFTDKAIREEKYSFVAKSNMFIGDVLRIDYLYKKGRRTQTIKECMDIYYPMAERTGTLWEFEDVTASCCHAFASICVCWLEGEKIIKHYD